MLIADKLSDVYYSCSNYIQKYTYKKKIKKIDDSFRIGQWYVVESALKQLSPLESTESYQTTLNWVIKRLIVLAPKYPRYVFYFVRNQLNSVTIGYDELKQAYWNNPELAKQLAHLSQELNSVEFIELLKSCHIFNKGADKSYLTLSINQITEFHLRNLFYTKFGMADQALQYENLRNTELSKILNQRFNGELDAYLIYYGNNIGILSSSKSNGLSGQCYYHHFYPDCGDLDNKITILIDVIKCELSGSSRIRIVDLLNNQPPEDTGGWTKWNSNNNKGYGTLLVKFGLFDVLSSLPSDNYSISGKFDQTDVQQPITSESNDTNLARRASFWRKMGFNISRNYSQIAMKCHSSQLLNFDLSSLKIAQADIKEFYKVIDKGNLVV